jgi:hypothetical protein
MDPAVWSCLPFQILELIFFWLPFPVLTRFRTVCKQWNVVLQTPSFLAQCHQVSNNGFGFLIPLVHRDESYFLGSYLNQTGRICHFHVPFIDSTYTIECTIRCMILFSSPTGCSLAKNYFVMNPFTKSFKNLGSIWVGDGGFFTLLENISARKYEWVVLKHISRKNQSKYFICSSLENVWRRTTIPYAGTTPPKEAVVYKSKIYWLYLDTDYDDYPRYGYTIYWLDISKNQWGFSFVPITDIRCMSLSLYNNQLICIINDGSTSVWCIEEVDNFQFGQPCIEQSLDYFEDDWGFKWSLLKHLSTDINQKCPGYLPFRTVGGIVLMCNNSKLPVMFYDLMTGLCFPTNITDVSILHNYGLTFPFQGHFNDLIEKGNVFPLLPNMDSVDDIPPLGIDVMA